MLSTIDIFCCCAREDQPLLHKLTRHLTVLKYQGLITIWSSADIDLGKERESESFDAGALSSAI